MVRIQDPDPDLVNAVKDPVPEIEGTQIDVTGLGLMIEGDRDPEIAMIGKMTVIFVMIWMIVIVHVTLMELKV